MLPRWSYLATVPLPLFFFYLNPAVYQRYLSRLSDFGAAHLGQGREALADDEGI